MTYPPYLREKARSLRVEKRLSLDEIAERLALPKTTVWMWIQDIPLQRPRAHRGQRAGNVAMQAKWRALREQSYAAGVESWAVLSADPGFRDFVTLFLAEGYKRSRQGARGGRFMAC